eukprot:CAMPEP_0182899242 /NCGR_PEP_ID=MMETSP0034_2-20130328/27962_1 /TAXON_ID=156128 /ORGANISM="Nephroselmis pyriformis, Strain CCMP717" /LENGTH=565 /DNA_ID=CAMNT_0025033255 /DNA_START=119 /DNA_END=1813 /DNA_ORIENTATION=-
MASARVYVLLLAALALNVVPSLGQWPPPPPPSPPNILQEEIRYSDGGMELKGMVVWNNNSIWHSRRGYYGTKLNPAVVLFPNQNKTAGIKEEMVAFATQLANEKPFVVLVAEFGLTNQRILEIDLELAASRVDSALSYIAANEMVDGGRIAAVGFGPMGGTAVLNAATQGGPMQFDHSGLMRGAVVFDPSFAARQRAPVLYPVKPDLLVMTPALTDNSQAVAKLFNELDLSARSAEEYGNETGLFEVHRLGGAMPHFWDTGDWRYNRGVLDSAWGRMGSWLDALMGTAVSTYVAVPGALPEGRVSTNATEAGLISESVEYSMPTTDGLGTVQLFGYLAYATEGFSNGPNSRPVAVLVGTATGFGEDELEWAHSLALKGYLVFGADILALGEPLPATITADSSIEEFFVTFVDGGPYGFAARVDAAVQEARKQYLADTENVMLIGYGTGGNGVINFVKSGRTAKLAVAVSPQLDPKFRLQHDPSLTVPMFTPLFVISNSREDQSGDVLLLEQEMEEGGLAWQTIRLSQTLIWNFLPDDPLYVPRIGAITEALVTQALADGIGEVTM